MKLGHVVEHHDTPKVPGTLEVMPPPPVGADEDRAALKPLIAVDFDKEPTLTARVVPGLVCDDGEGPTALSSAKPDDFQVSGRDVGFMLVVVDSEPRRRELHGWNAIHGPPVHARSRAQKYTEVTSYNKRAFSQISNMSHTSGAAAHGYPMRNQSRLMSTRPNRLPWLLPLRSASGCAGRWARRQRQW